MIVPRSSVSLFLVLIMALPMVTFTEPGDADTASSNIYITSNSALSTSPFVSSGDGSVNSPYIIRDWDMGAYNIRLENINSYVEIVNITFSSSSQWCFYLLNSANIRVDTVNATNRGLFLYSNNCNMIWFKNCNVTSIPTQTNVVDIRNGISFTISESRFVHQEGETATISFNNQGSNQRFINNLVEGIPFVDSLFGSDGLIKNCTFKGSPVTLTGGLSGAEIAASTFDSPGKNALTLITSYFLDINNNFFRGINGIYFSTTQWQTSNDYGKICNNTFESCSNGINTIFTYQSRPSKYEIFGNYFGNCSMYAMDLGWSLSMRIWNNIFYHNAGTDNSTGGSQCKHTNYPQSLYKIYWTVDGEGNFWANHRTPDDDNNGIVDVPYTINTGGTDDLPYTNPYLDTDPPIIEVTSPTALYPDRSYLIIQWNAEDIGSGIKEIRMKIDSGPWIDVTGMSERSVFLDEGNHFINFEIMDRAGLMNTTKVQYIVDQTEEILTLISPANGEYLSESDVRVEWSIEDYFIPANQSLLIDGNRIYMSPEQRALSMVMTEGPHSLMLDVKDSTGVGYPVSINFTVDLTDPEVEILSPQSGTSLSNTYIKINYLVTDNTALSGLNIRIDDGDWMQRPLHETSFPILLDEGSHEVEVKGTDMAGRETSENVSFLIGGSPLLSFIDPPNGTSTRDSEVQVKWEYTGPFIWNRSLLKVGRSGDFIDLFGQKVTNITLGSDGEYQLILRLVDIFGNYIETKMTLIKDTTEPFVGFLKPIDTEMIGSSLVDLEWRGADNNDLPIARYFLKIDNGPWMNMGNQTINSVDLTEGEHKLSIRAVDLAGNIGENSITVTVDVTPPELGLLTPSSGDVITDSFVLTTFEATDNMGLALLNLTVDGRINISVLGKTSHMTTIGTDGEHTLTLTAIDLAGNVRSISITVMVDLTEPVIEWIHGPDVIISETEYTLSWNITDASGISKIVLKLGDKEIDLDPDQVYYTAILEAGLYSVSLMAIDNAGLSTEILSTTGILIDLTLPEVRIDEERSKVTGNSAQFFWFAADEDSGVFEEYVSRDGGEFIKVLSDSAYTFEGLDEGIHNITVRVFDRAGNYKDTVWTVTIDFDGQEEVEDSDEGNPLWILLLVVGVFVIISILIMFFVITNRRKQREEEEKERSIKARRLDKPSRVKMNIPASPMPSALPPETGPPVKKVKVEETETGSGYIRPEKKGKKAGKKKSFQDAPEKKDIQTVSPASETSFDDAYAPPEETPVREIQDDFMDHEKPKDIDAPTSDDPEEEDTGISSENMEFDQASPEPSEEPEKVSWDEDGDVEEFEDLDDMEEFEDLDDLEEVEEFEELDDIEDAVDWNEDEMEEWG